MSNLNVTFVMELSYVTGMNADELSPLDWRAVDSSDAELNERVRRDESFECSANPFISIPTLNLAPSANMRADVSCPGMMCVDATLNERQGRLSDPQRKESSAPAPPAYTISLECLNSNSRMSTSV